MRKIKVISLALLSLFACANVTAYESLPLDGDNLSDIDKITSDYQKKDVTYGKAVISFKSERNKDQIVNWAIGHNAVIDGLRTRVKGGSEVYTAEMRTLATENHKVYERIQQAENRHRASFLNVIDSMEKRGARGRSAEEHLQVIEEYKASINNEVLYDAVTVFAKLSALIAFHQVSDIASIRYLGPISEEDVEAQKQMEPLPLQNFKILGGSSLGGATKSEGVLLKAPYA